MSTEWEVQKAVYNAIKAAMPATVPVLDNVPDNQAAPYVSIGDGTDIEWDTDDSYGRETTITVHTWSSYRGMKEVKELMFLIKTALHNVSLVVTGEKLVLCFWEFSETMLDSDGLTRHGVQRFRLITEGG
jgi:hypothetical protein